MSKKKTESKMSLARSCWGLKKSQENQLAYLSHAVLLEEAENPRLIRRVTQVTMLTLLLFIVWAIFTPVDELSRGSGEIVPSRSIQKVQHYEGGIIKEISVEDGQFVDAGDVLIRLRSVSAVSELNAMRSKSAGLMIESERLRAYTENRVPDFTAFSYDYVDLVEDQEKLLKSARNDRYQQIQIFDRKINQEEKKLAGLQKQVLNAKEKVSIAQEELNINQALYKKGSNSRVSYLNAKRGYAQAEDNLISMEAKLNVAREVIEQTKSEKSQVDTRLRQQAFEALANVEKEHVALVENIKSLEDRSSRLDVVSPTRGIVKGLNATTIGAVIVPGGDVAEIVPVDQQLIVEAKLSTRDIGHIKVGQPVNVKVEAYDFSRYGGLDGTLRKISATTFRDEKTNEPYYKGAIELSQNYVGQSSDRNPVLPGMTVQADIITGQKSVIAYLLKPVALAASTAFSER